MSLETGRTTRVIGWYHSHPHITVLPSHVGKSWSTTSVSCFLLCVCVCIYHFAAFPYWIRRLCRACMHSWIITSISCQDLLLGWLLTCWNWFGSSLMKFLDVRTQAMYQLLDTGFIGLIFSCFNEDVNKVTVTFFH